MVTVMTEDETKAVCRDIANRQRYRPGAKRISSVINQLMTRRGYARLQASTQWDMAWREAVGDRLAKHSRTGNVRRGVLDIFVRNSAVVQELTFCKQRLIKQLARLNPGQKVRDLRFRVGPID
jgi:predicted nucleic acid-binding Zn ribbon protein